MNAMILKPIQFLMPQPKYSQGFFSRFNFQTTVPRTGQSGGQFWYCRRFLVTIKTHEKSVN
jgi:hypothetical protein